MYVCMYFNDLLVTYVARLELLRGKRIWGSGEAMLISNEGILI